jgi:hypothetical protein
MEDVGFKQTLITKLVPQMKVLQFHLLCEYKGWEHIVKRPTWLSSDFRKRKLEKDSWVGDLRIEMGFSSCQNGGTHCNWARGYRSKS